MSRFTPVFRNQDLSWFDEFFKESANSGLANLPVDIKETEKAFNIIADLPGVKKDEISVEFHDGVLTLSGSRDEKEEKHEGTYHRVERKRGSFSRSFRLGSEVDSSKIEATYINGVLNVQVPKTEATQKRRIEVRETPGPGPKRID